MSNIVMLDSGPLGMVTNPKTNISVHQECKLWLDNLPLLGYEIILPEITDYEVRRELLRSDKLAGIRRLDQLKAAITYLPITTETMLLAAELWAEVRRKGRTTADSTALDGDVILAAQAILQQTEARTVIVATTNVKHLSIFVDAREWHLIV